MNSQAWKNRSGIQRQYGAALVWVLQALDIFVALLIFYILTLIRRNGDFPVEYQILAMIAAMSILIIYQWTGAYQLFRSDDLFSEARALLKAWVILLFVLATLGFATKTNEVFSREVLLSWSVLGYAGQLGIHAMTRAILRSMRSRGRNLRRAILVGSGEPVRDFAERLARNPWLGIEAVGYVSLNREAETDATGPKIGDLPCLGGMKSVAETVREHGVDLVYITLPMAQTHQIEDAARELMGLHVDVHWVPDISALQLINHSMREIEGQPVLCLSDSPISGIRRLGKWIEDKVLAILILAVASPVMLAVAMAIRLTSAGPVLFRQTRAGLNGKPISVYKFRSMVVHDEPEGMLTQAVPNDKRITKVGAFLRRTSLDELPQLFNVLNGTMSIVGPRPHAVEHDGYYERQIDAYMLRHRIKPGITGWAQVNGWRGNTDKLEQMEIRVQHDLYYINNWTITFDLAIIALTVVSMINSKDAY